MDGFEPKKMALLRIWQILREYSDRDHPLTQDDILSRLKNGYGIVIERKAIGRNISLLKEAGIKIESRKAGSYIARREFDDSELRLLIGGVLQSRYITAKESKSLVDRLCGLSNKYFKSGIKHLRSADCEKADGKLLLHNAELIDTAIEEKRMIRFAYNEYGADKLLHKASEHEAYPYRMILHDGRVYLSAYVEKSQSTVLCRLDRITDMTLTDRKAVLPKGIKGFKAAADRTDSFAAGYTEEPENISFIADAEMTGIIVDRFGGGVRISKSGEGKITVAVKSSSAAMTCWALQYADRVEVVLPVKLRSRIKAALESGLEKYRT